MLMPTFAYARAERVLIRLEDLLSHPPVARMPNLLLVGETNTGKTVIAETFVRRHPASDNLASEFVSVPVLLIQAPPGGSISRLYRTIIDQFFIRMNQPKRLEHAASIMLKQLRNSCVRLIIIDEVQHMLTASPRGIREFLDNLKWLGNEIRVPIVAIGVPDARRPFSRESQLANRFEIMSLSRWKFGEEYFRFLDAVDDWIPLQGTSGLQRDDVAREIFTMSEGILGEVTDVIKKSAIWAIRSGDERITMKALNRIDFTPPSKRG
jgi:DNA transposition AAA+ family ATPase